MKLTEKQKKDIFERIYIDIKYGRDTCSHTFGMFLKKNCSIHYSDNAPAAALINMETFEMTMNPNIIATEISNIFINILETEGDLNKLFETYLFNNTKNIYSSSEELTKLFKLYLTLHEIGHYLYSPSATTSLQYYKGYCKEIEIKPTKKMKAPMELAFFVTNVVEDMFIQQQFRRDYPGRTYDLAFRFGQIHSQGNISEYGKHVVEDETMSIHNKLYYFILRGYNEFDANILNMFGHPEKLGWSQKTCQAFDLAQTYVDKLSRLKYTMEVVVPLVFKDLIEEVKANGEEEGESSGSLVQEDKIRISDSENSNSSSKPQKNQKDKKEEENTETNSNSSSQKQEESDSSEKSSNKSSNESSEEKDSEESQSKDITEETKEKSDKKSEEELFKEFEEAVKKACDELNKHLDETKKREDAPKGALKPNSDINILKRKMDAIGCSIKEWDEYKNSGGYLDAQTMELYDSCSAYFSKLYNMEDYTIHRLEQGEIDPTTMIEWYTEKNHQIYSVDIKTNQGRTFQIIFILDMSGSMGLRFTDSSKIIAAMAHALDDVRIPTAIYLFDDDSVQVKKLNDPVILNGNDSSVFATLINNRTGGCTNPTGAFDALLYDPTYQTDDTKIVFFLTDGMMDSKKVEESVHYDIQELSQRGNWFFMCIGIDFDDDDLERLSLFTTPAVCRSYTRREIVEKLGEDIYNIIVDNFIKV